MDTPQAIKLKKSIINKMRWHHKIPGKMQHYRYSDVLMFIAIRAEVIMVDYLATDEGWKTIYATVKNMSVEDLITLNKKLSINAS